MPPTTLTPSTTPSNPGSTGNTAIDGFLGKVETNIINPAIEVLALVAFILFLYGVVEFIRGATNEEKRKTGQMHMIYGVVGLALLFGAKTVVAILQKIVAS